MNQPHPVPPGAIMPGESERVRLARVALAAALQVPGVVGTAPGPLGAFITGARDGERLEGVMCVAAPGDGYDVSLRLACELVALHPLAERVRAAVGKAAVRASVDLESVSVHFAELVEPGER